jgi:hypothetical protein
MSSSEQIRKMKGHTEHILDLFIGLKEKYQFLEPMLFKGVFFRNYGAGRRIVVIT